MALRRSLTTKAKFFTQQRFSPSITYVNHHDDHKNQHLDEKAKSFLQNRSYGVLPNYTNTLRINGACGSGLNFQDPKWSQVYRQAQTTTNGFLLTRNISSQVPVVNEVSVAMADSSFPVAAMQWAIDRIHNFTGLNWWASIVIATVVIKSFRIPLWMYSIVYGEKYKRCGLSVEMFMRDKTKFNQFWKIVGINFIFSCVDCCFLLAIANMVQKVPSFATGGASWFVDLTTRDLFGLPLIYFVTAVCCDPKLIMNDDSESKVNFAFLVPAVIPFLPKAYYLYCITHNLFYIVFMLILKTRGVQKLLNYWINM